MTRRQEVLERLCELTSKVGSNIDPNTVAATDCFCTEQYPGSWEDSRYRFDDEVIEFIEAAVNEKLGE